MKFFRMRKLMKLRKKLEHEIAVQKLYQEFEVAAEDLKNNHRKYDDATDATSKKLYFEQMLNATDRQLRLIEKLNELRNQ